MRIRLIIISVFNTWSDAFHSAVVIVASWLFITNCELVLLLCLTSLNVFQCNEVKQQIHLARKFTSFYFGGLSWEVKRSWPQLSVRVSWNKPLAGFTVDVTSLWKTGLVLWSLLLSARGVFTEAPGNVHLRQEVTLATNQIFWINNKILNIGLSRKEVKVVLHQSEVPLILLWFLHININAAATIQSQDIVNDPVSRAESFKVVSCLSAGKYLRQWINKR